MAASDMGPGPTYEGIGVRSGLVMTVRGAIPVEDLGVTLTHDHVFFDSGANGPEPEDPVAREFFRCPLTIDILGDVRALPQSNRDNQFHDDLELAVAEVGKYRQQGGVSILECSTIGIGRNPVGLRTVSERTGVNIVMAAGYYSEVAHPAHVKGMSADDIADEVVRDIVEGVPGSGLRAGIIGEIGIDIDFTPEEEKNLRGACRASARTQVPLSIHSLGVSGSDTRRRIMDIVEEEGADLGNTIMDHMTLRPIDFDQHLEIARRGAFLGYDTISSDFNWGRRGSGLCDWEIAECIRRLVDAGFVDHVVLAQDVSMKNMLTAYGGGGYGYILKWFVPLLRESGVGDEHIRTMLVDNPRRLYSPTTTP